MLEIGGTHVTVAWASGAGEVEIIGRHDLDNAASAEHLIAAVVEAGRTLQAHPGVAWGCAMPGPFDYERGIGDFTGVDKFAAWHGHDVGAGLRAGLRAGAMHFINDADAFGVGEASAGRTRECVTSLGLTIGTGIGSAFIHDGVPVLEGPGIPELGEVHTLRHEGTPLEELVSRGALRTAYQRVSGTLLDVHEIAALAYDGDEAAMAVFDAAYGVLAEVIGPVAQEFGAEAIVVGGSIARSSHLLDAYFASRLTTFGPGGEPLPVWFSENAEHSAIVGTAHWANLRELGQGFERR